MFNSRIAYLCVFLAAACWGSTAAVVKLLVSDLSALQALFFMCLFASLSLIVISLLTGQGRLLVSYSGKDLAAFAVMGFFGNFLYNLLLYIAIDLLPAQEAFLINYLWPVMVVIFSIIILREPATARKLLGILCSFLGVAVVVTGGSISGLSFSSPAGVACACLGAVVYGCYSVVGKRYKYEPFTSVAYFYLFATLYCLVFLLREGVPALSARQWGGLVFLGTVAGGLGYAFWFCALRYGDTARMATMIFLTPFLSLVYIRLLIREPILPSSVIGLILITTGIVIQSARRTGRSPRAADGV